MRWTRAPPAGEERRDKIKEMERERRNRYRKASRNRFTGSKFQGLESPATKPQRKLFLQAHLPRRSRRSNRTENTEPRTDNGWSWTTRPPGSLPSLLSLSLSSRETTERAPYAAGSSFINRRSVTATFDHFLTLPNPERNG